MPTAERVLAGSQQRGFVDQIRQVGADEARADRGHFRQLDGRVQLDGLDVHFQDVLAAADVGPVDQHLAIESSRTQEGLIEHLGAIRGGHHNHAVVGVESVHFDQQGIQRLLTLIMPPDKACPSGLAERIQFVNENDARRLRDGLLKHVADAGRTDADEHLHKVRTRQTVKRHAGLARDRLGQQGLARPGRAHQQHALRDSTAQSLVFVG